MPKAYYFPYQNPTYPENQDATTEEIERAARAASLARARSPNPLICALEGVWSIDDPLHAHPFRECMEYRHQHVVGDNEPWTYWQLLDAPLLPPKTPLPPLPVGLKDWQLRAIAGEIAVPGAPLPPVPPPKPGPDGEPTRVWTVRAQVPPAPTIAAPTAISTGWNGYSFTLWISPSVISPLDGGLATRLTLMGSFTLDALYIGTVDYSDPTGYTMANMQRFTFGGGTSWDGTATMDEFGQFIPLVTDPLEVPIDGSQSIVITGYFNAANDGVVGSAFGEVGWEGNWISGDNTADAYRGIYEGSFDGSLAVIILEGLYDQVSTTGT
jgi:hypothetical protein